MATTAISNQVQPSAVAEKARFLRRVLRGNALFSLISGSLVVIDSRVITEFLGITSQQYLGFLSGNASIIALGAGIVLFGTGVGWVAMQQPLNQVYAQEIMVLDIVWVILSAIVLLTNALSLSTAGSWAVLIIADIVAIFVGLENYGLRRMRQ